MAPYHKVGANFAEPPALPCREPLQGVTLSIIEDLILIWLRNPRV